MIVNRKYDAKGNLVHFSCPGYSSDTEYAANNEIIKKTICGEVCVYQQKAPNVMFPPNKLGMFYPSTQLQLQHENKQLV